MLIEIKFYFASRKQRRFKFFDIN